MPDAEFPVQCPKCGWTAGYPRQAGSYDFRNVEVWVRCRVCQHEWTTKIGGDSDDSDAPSDAE